MDIHIGYDRSEPCFPGKGGTRMECPYCDWYLDHTPMWTDVVYEPRYMYDHASVSIPNYRAMWTRIDLIATAHLIDAHSDEPEVQRAVQIQLRKNAAAGKPAVMCPTCGATWGRIATYQCDGPRDKPHPRVRTVPYVD